MPFREKKYLQLKNSKSWRVKTISLQFSIMKTNISCRRLNTKSLIQKQRISMQKNNTITIITTNNENEFKYLSSFICKKE